jgi:anaerobic selenocysteine-containing dehydrogenase
VPPAKDRARIETYFDPLPFWYPPFEEARIDPDSFPLRAITQRPMQMYHSWHSQNAWLRQILGQNRLFMNRVTARGLGLADDDWVWVSSHAGRIEAQLKLMDGVNPDTVWTWNAIGKRSGAWNLAADSPESARGFLLNHLITEMLPETDGDAGMNADPVTGQAAWYDLRVRVEKVLPAETGHTTPRFPALVRPPSLMPPREILRYGAPRPVGETPREPTP